MTSIPLKREGHKTILILENIKFDISLPDKIFTLENLENLVKRIR